MKSLLLLLVCASAWGCNSSQDQQLVLRVVRTFVVPAIDEDSSGLWNNAQMDRAIKLAKNGGYNGVTILPGFYTFDHGIYFDTLTFDLPWGHLDSMKVYGWRVEHPENDADSVVDSWRVKP